MAQNVFPQTKVTWIGQELAAGHSGRRNVNVHIMATYAWPLKVYFLGTNARWLGEPDDVVDGFLANRLGRDNFLSDWQQSGKRLRRWLMNAFCFYLKELYHQHKKYAPVESPVEDDVSFSGDPDAAFDRASVLAFVQRALDQAAEECRRKGLTDHLEIFRRHHIDDAPYQQLCEEFGVTAERAAVMARTAARTFRSAVRGVIEADGVPADQVDQEIEALLDATGASQ